MTGLLAGSLAGLTRTEVEDFLYLEAELLDAWELDDWLRLYTDDARYVIPCTGDPAGDPSRDLVLIDDNRLRMQARVERLNSRKAHREYPHSNTRHLVTNVRLGPVEADELPVRASFSVWRFRGGRFDWRRIQRHSNRRWRRQWLVGLFHRFEILFIFARAPWFGLIVVSDAVERDQSEWTDAPSRTRVTTNIDRNSKIITVIM